MLLNNAKLIQSITNQGKKETILTKTKNLLVRGPVNFERYEEQVNHWDQENKDSDLNKFNLLRNDLTTKKETSSCVMMVIHDITHKIKI